MNGFIAPQKMCVLHILMDNEMTTEDLMNALCRICHVDFDNVPQKERDWFYVLISRLKSSGYIEAVGKTKSSGVQGGKPKEIYCITDLGKAEYENVMPLAQKIINVDCESASTEEVIANDELHLKNVIYDVEWNSERE